MRASYGGYTDLVAYLLNKGADKTVKDNNGRVAFEYLPLNADDEIKKLLK